MRKIMTVILLLAFALNSFAASVGIVVLCSHEDHFHIELNKEHSCCDSCADKDCHCQKISQCDDFVLNASTAPQNLADILRLPAAVFVEIESFSRIFSVEIKNDFNVKEQNRPPIYAPKEILLPLII